MTLVSDFYRHEESLRQLIRNMIQDPAALTLDVGCKHGDISQTFAGRVRRLVGLDLFWHDEWTGIDIEGLDFVNADAVKLPFRGNSFDMIIASESLQYVPRPDIALDEFYRVLKSQGTLVMSFPEGGPAANGLDPYNLKKRLLSLFSRGKKDQKFLVHHRAQEILRYSDAKWRCRKHYRRGSLLFIEISFVIDVFQSMRQWLLRSPGGLRNVLADWIMKPVIRLLMLMMKLDFAISWGPLSYNNVIRLQKIG